MAIGESSNRGIYRILLVRLRLIGDVVCTTPAVRAIRLRFPDAHMTYVVEPAAAPIVEGNPHLNEVIVAPSGRGLTHLQREARLLNRLRLSRPPRKRRTDLTQHSDASRCRDAGRTRAARRRIAARDLSRSNAPWSKGPSG